MAIGSRELRKCSESDKGAFAPGVRKRETVVGVEKCLRFITVEQTWELLGGA